MRKLLKFWLFFIEPFVLVSSTNTNPFAINQSVDDNRFENQKTNYSYTKEFLNSLDASKNNNNRQPQENNALKEKTKEFNYVRYNKIPFKFSAFLIYPAVKFSSLGFKNKNLLIFIFLLLVLGLFSTFWNLRLYILFCFTKCSKGSYILFKNKIHRIRKTPEGVETFSSNHSTYILKEGKVELLSPKNDYTYQELINGVVLDNYKYYPENKIIYPKQSFLRLFTSNITSPKGYLILAGCTLRVLDKGVMFALAAYLIIFSLQFIWALSIFYWHNANNESGTESLTCFVKRIRRGNGKEISQGELINSSMLKPGDKILLSSPCEAPCDLVILDGRCACDESMFTGQTDYVYKYGLINLKNEAYNEGKTLLNIRKNEKNILFAGSKISSVNNEAPMTCMVLRIGSNTKLGKLLVNSFKPNIYKDQEEKWLIIIFILIGLFNSLLFLQKFSEINWLIVFFELAIIIERTFPIDIINSKKSHIENASLFLRNHQISCLNTSKIPLIGKVDICCFDKTGSLVDSDEKMEEIVFSNEKTGLILSCCHDLVDINGKLTGYPLEMAIYEKIKNNHAHITSKLISFHFDPKLRRQGVLINREDKNRENQKVFCLKGAPEEMEKFLSLENSKEYSMYKEYSRRGFKVIALGCKILKEDANIDRESLENDLEFCGFALFKSPIKSNANRVCSKLKELGIKTLMITEDNLDIAQNVAKEVGIIGNYSEADGIDEILRDDKKFKKCSIFAKTSPIQKEAILKKLKDLGHCTMVVGNGKNDAHLLQMADVGIATIGPAKLKSDKKLLKSNILFTIAPFVLLKGNLDSILDMINIGRYNIAQIFQSRKILIILNISKSISFILAMFYGLPTIPIHNQLLSVFSSLAHSFFKESDPMNQSSGQMPPSSIFSLYSLVSIFFQTLFHFITFPKFCSLIGHV